MNNTKHTPINNDTAIELRVARYTSRLMTQSQSDTMLADIGAAVTAAQPTNVQQSVAFMTIVTGFIADVAPSDGGSLNDFLNEATISRWVSTSRTEGKSAKTLSTRRGILMRVLRAHRGVAAHIRNGPARRPTTAPLTDEQIDLLAQGCLASCRSAWRGFVAHVGAGVPIATPGILFASGKFSYAASSTTAWMVAYTGHSDALTALAGDYLIDADWEALRDVADDLGIALTRDIVAQTYRFLASSDERLTVGERLRQFHLTQISTTSLSHFLRADAHVLSASDRFHLREGFRNGDCTETTTSTLSVRVHSRASEEVSTPVTRMTSRAAVKRLTIERVAEMSARQMRSQPVLDYLATFIPDRDDAIWLSIADCARTSVARCNFTSIKQAREHIVALSTYLRWRAEHGLACDASSLSFAAIDVFFARGMPDLSKRTKGDYRSRLRHVAACANASIDAPPSLELGHNAVNPGYDAKEEQDLRRWARMQSQLEVRRRLCAIVGLCGGAGLSSRELRALKRNDIDVEEDGTIVVSVAGQRPRQTVVRRAYEELVHIALSGLKRDQLLLPALKSSSPITAIVKGADDLGCTVTLDTRRLRTTWICWLMGQHVSLKLAFEASGLQSARTFYDMLAHLPAVAPLNELRDGGAK